MEEGGDRVDAAHRRKPSRAVVEAIAEAEDVAPVDLQPPEYESLYAAVDPTALDDLFAPRYDGTPRPGGDVTFTFCGYRVSVAADGEVTLDRIER